MIAISLLMALSFLAAFIWAVRRGEYADTYTPSVRILLDDTPEPIVEEVSSSKLKTENKD